MKDLIDKIIVLKQLYSEPDVDSAVKSQEGKLLNALVETVISLSETMVYSISRLPSAPTHFHDMITEDNRFVCPNCRVQLDILESIIEDENHIICPHCNGPIMIETNDF